LIRTFVLALAALVAAALPQSGAQERSRVVTTSADLRSLVEAVGGDGVEVVSLAAPEQDPHAIELKPGQLMLLRRADLIVKVGLDHEPWLARLSKPPAPVLDVSRSVSLLQAETPRLRVERRAHVHAFGNTHYWLDPRNAEPITAAILSALAHRHPAGAPAFAANRDAFLARLSLRIAAWEALLEPYAGTRVVVVHDSWSYFAARFRLKIMAAAEPQPGVPPSPAELAALFKAMREAQVRILIADPHSNPALVRQIAEKSGARAVTLLPSGDDYIGLLEENVRRLAQALKPS
jgi:ABC-type Zn uptake system ZnuABC Zn-binding protein ZnuA